MASSGGQRSCHSAHGPDGWEEPPSLFTLFSRLLEEKKNRLCPPRDSSRPSGQGYGGRSSRQRSGTAGSASSVAAEEPEEDALVVLGLQPDASLEEVHRQYRKLALLYHPDKNTGDPSATAKFLRVHKAVEEMRQRLAPSVSSSSRCEEESAQEEQKRRRAEEQKRRREEDARLFRSAWRKAKPKMRRQQVAPIHGERHAEFSSSVHPIAVALRARALTRMVELLRRSAAGVREDLGRGSTVFHFAAWHDDRGAFDVVMQLAGESWWRCLVQMNGTGERPVDAARASAAHLLEHLEALTAQAHAKRLQVERKERSDKLCAMCIRVLLASFGIGFVWLTIRCPVSTRSKLTLTFALLLKSVLGFSDTTCCILIVVISMWKAEALVVSLSLLWIAWEMLAQVLHESYGEDAALLYLIYISEAKAKAFLYFESWVHPLFLWITVLFCLYRAEQAPEVAKPSPAKGPAAQHQEAGPSTPTPRWVRKDPGDCPKCDPRPLHERHTALQVEGQVECVRRGVRVNKRHCRQERALEPVPVARVCSGIPPCDSCSGVDCGAGTCFATPDGGWGCRCNNGKIYSRRPCPVKTHAWKLPSDSTGGCPTDCERLPTERRLRATCVDETTGAQAADETLCLSKRPPDALIRCEACAVHSWTILESDLRCPTACDSPPTVLRVSPVCVNEATGEQDPQGVKCKSKRQEDTVIHCNSTAACARCPPGTSGPCSAERYEWRRGACPSDCGLTSTTRLQNCVRAWDGAMVHNKFCGEGALHGSAEPPSYSCQSTEPCDPCEGVFCAGGSCLDGFCICDLAHVGPFCLLPARVACMGQNVLIAVLLVLAIWKSLRLALVERRQVRSADAAVQTRKPEKAAVPSCVVCLERPAAFAAIPCGHLSYCPICAKRVKDTCSVCRTSPVKMYRIFDDGVLEL